MIYLFRIYQWLIAAPILLVITFLTCIVTFLSVWLFGHSWGGYYPARLWSRCVCMLWGVRVKVKGAENIDPKQSYVFVANHQGAFDIWSIYGYLPHRFKWLMKKSLRKVFFVGAACEASGHVFVDDSSVQGIRTTIEQAEKRLKGGMSVVIFPEGSRSWDGRMGAFKRGAFLLAAEFRLPVVPISIDGSFRAMPRTTYNVRPGVITLTIHRPIMAPAEGFNTRALMKQCREEIAGALPEEKEDAHKAPDTNPS